ncbi:MAG: GNAT family N-acetyltransferase [Castellaniella sp.]|nr:GNAT family N-acetyltransferase [Castellaniella sp.]
MILYLHGFRSSPDSSKARLMAAALAERSLGDAWCCPQLPASPAAALRLALRLAEEAQTSDLTLVGSSLGGFYATWLAERLGCRAVLLNPVVHAARDLATQVGSHRTFHGDDPFEFLPDYVDELAQAEAEIPVLTHPDRYFLVAATGDEVLDWREMQARFAGSRQRIIQGSDHGISDFARWLPEVLDFALADAPQKVTSANPSRRGARVATGSWAELGTEAARIRFEVFVQEQRVPPEEELDPMDGQCVHAIAYAADGQAVGTGRLLPDGHIGRMAVRQPWRGQGVGSLLLAALMDAARQRGDREVVLAAQLHARPFYARHGFVEEGETFMDAGIPHRLMRYSFAAR